MSEAVSGIDAHAAWWGDEKAGKSWSEKWKLGTNKAQKPARQDCAGFLMAELKQNQHCERLDY